MLEVTNGWDVVPRLIIWSFIVIVFAWDVIATSMGHGNSTVSIFLLNMSRQHPIVAFIFGLLAGHAFWPNGS